MDTYCDHGLHPPPAATAHLHIKRSPLTCSARPLTSYCPNRTYSQSWPLQVHMCAQWGCGLSAWDLTPLILQQTRCRKRQRSVKLSFRSFIQAAALSEVCSGRAPPTWRRSLWSSKTLQERCSLLLRWERVKTCSNSWLLKNAIEWNTDCRFQNL